MIRSFCSQWRDIITFIIRKEFSKLNKTNAGSNGLEPWPGLVLLRICLAQGTYTLWRSSRQGLTRLLLRGDLVSNWSQKVPLHIHSLAEGRDVPSPESWINAQLLCTLPPKGGQHAQQKEWKSKTVRRCELQRVHECACRTPTLQTRDQVSVVPSDSRSSSLSRHGRRAVGWPL